MEKIDVPAARRVIDKAQSAYLPPEEVEAFLSAAGIPQVKELICATENEALSAAKEVGYPCVMKVVGPIHKTDVRGVVLNIHSDDHLLAEFKRMMKIKDASAVMLQPMLKGHELFIGATYEKDFGHVVLCGLGGIFIEVLKDVTSGLAPLTFEEALKMIRQLRSYKLIEGTRGQEGVNEKLFAQLMVQLSSVLRFCTEVVEMDINPLIGLGDKIVAVDARIRIEKKNER